MLVLSRKANESIHIGSDITVKVLSVGKNRVTIGIVGPDNVVIRRAELKPLAQQVARRPLAPRLEMSLSDLVSVS